MEFQRLAGGGQSGVQFPAEESQENLGSGQLHRQRIDRADLLYLLQGLLQTSGTGVDHAQTHMRGRPFGFVSDGLKQFGFRLREFVLEDMETLSPVAAQIRGQAAQGDGPVVRLEESLVHFASGPHPAGAHHHIALGSTFKRPRIVAFARRPLEVTQGFLKPFPGTAIPAVPALADQIVRLGGLKAVAHARAVTDPGAEFAQDLLHFPHGNGDRVLGYQVAVPSLLNHSFVIHMPAAVLNQHLQDV